MKKLQRRAKKIVKKANGQRGKIERGVIFIVVIIITLIFLGYMFVGGNLPTELPQPNSNLVQIISPSFKPAQNALQMYTFQGVTVTPYPTLNVNVPQPKNSLPLTPASCYSRAKSNFDMVWAYGVAQTAGSGNQQALIVYYIAKNAMLLGAGSPTAMKKFPSDHVSNPNVGNTGTKDQYNLPYFPAVFITDITTNARATSGDSENGGTAQQPDDVYGAWKALNGQDPSDPNYPDLGPGADNYWPPSNGPGSGSHVTTFAAEVIWQVRSLKTNTGASLESGHKYRLEIVLHDGNNPPEVAEFCPIVKLP